MSSPPTGILFYDARAKPLSTTGAIQPGCYYQFYSTGTLNLANVYNDGALTSVMSQTPVTGGTTAASDGRLPPIYLNPAVIYRYQLYSSGNVLLADIDPWVPPAQFFLRAVKASDTVRTSIATMTNDPDLQVTLVPGTWHYKIGMIWVAAASGTTPGSRTAPSYSGTVTNCSIALGGDANAISITGAANTSVASFSSPILNAVTATGPDFQTWDSMVTVTTAGTLALQWAQQNSSSNSLTLKAGSFIYAHQLA